MTTATNNLIRVGIILSMAFIMFLGLPIVKANTFSEVLVGYGYTPVSNDVVGSRSWVAYNSSNLVNYGYNMGDSYYYQIDEFNVRFRATGGFQRGTNYTITFTWDNYHPTIDSTNFYADWLLMNHNLLCYSSSWSSSSQSGSSCFTSYNSSAVQNGNNSIIVTINIVPSADFYGLMLQNNHGSTITYYKTIGWEVYDISYSYSSDGSQDIINNQNQNTQSIINNQDSNTQDIINNQNQNTQAIIDSNKNCSLIDSSLVIQKDKYFTSTGTISTSTTLGITDYINIYGGTLEVLTAYNTTSRYSCFYDVNKVLISCVPNSDFVANSNYTYPTNSYYLRATIQYSGNNANRPRFKLCKNGSQAITDALTDSSSPDTSSLSNATGWLPPGPVDSILNLPLTLLQSLNNAFSTSSCQPLVIHFPHVATPVPIPCMSTIWENFGLLPLFTWIGRVIGGILLYKYLINLYKWVDDTLTMRENNNFDDGSLG